MTAETLLTSENISDSKVSGIPIIIVLVWFLVLVVLGIQVVHHYENKSHQLMLRLAETAEHRDSLAAAVLNCREGHNITVWEGMWHYVEVQCKPIYRTGKRQ